MITVKVWYNMDLCLLGTTVSKVKLVNQESSASDYVLTPFRWNVCSLFAAL